MLHAPRFAVVDLSDAVKTVLSETAAELTGTARRRFMARTVCELFGGVINRAVRELGWDERMLRKALLGLAREIRALQSEAVQARIQA